MLVLGLSGISFSQTQTQPPTSAPSNDPFGSITSPPTLFQTSSPAPASLPKPSTQTSRSTPDPFAALASPGPRQASPFQFQQSLAPSRASDLLGMGSSVPSSGLAQNSSATANDDDEWTFEAAIPDQSKDITVNDTSINVVFNVSRESDTVLLIQSRISNKTPKPITDLTFRVAVSKVCRSSNPPF